MPFVASTLSRRQTKTIRESSGAHQGLPSYASIKMHSKLLDFGSVSSTISRQLIMRSISSEHDSLELVCFCSVCIYYALVISF